MFHQCFDMRFINEKLLFSHILILRSEVGKAVIGNQDLQGGMGRQQILDLDRCHGTALKLLEG